MNGLARGVLKVVHRFRGHSPQCSVRGTISGHWVWYAGCRCGAVRRGAEFDLDTAKRRAIAGRRPTWRPCGNELAEQLWPEVPTVRRSAWQIELPDEVRGQGDIVACDASLRTSDGHACWAFVTNAGWSNYGILPIEGATTNRLELLAIANALRIYPAGSDVWVQTDNWNALSVARRVLLGQIHHRGDMPSWTKDAEFRMLLSARRRGMRVRVVKVPSKLTPLHNIADELAKQRGGITESMEAAA